MTGIFWLTQNSNAIFYATTEPIEQSEAYGKWIISKYNHFEVWEYIKVRGLLKILPLHYQEEYFYLPRGRVSYNIETNKFCIFYGNWLNENNKELLCKHYKLSIENTEFITDEHYNL